jgi:hypothetical protein
MACQLTFALHNFHATGHFVTQKTAAKLSREFKFSFAGFPVRNLLESQRL